MQRDSRLTLASLDFHRCMCMQASNQYLPKDWYQKQLKSVTPEDVHPLYGLRLDLETLSSEPTLSYPSIRIVQVFDSTRLWLNDSMQLQQASTRQLHELVVIVWDCHFDTSTFKVGQKVETIADQLCVRKLYMVLDETFEVDAAHGYQEGHLALVFDRQTYDHVVAHSDLLAEAVQDQLLPWYEVWLGPTLQRAYENQLSMEKAWNVVHKALSPVEFAHVALTLLDPVDCNETYLKRAGHLPCPRRVDCADALADRSLMSFLTMS